MRRLLYVIAVLALLLVASEATAYAATTLTYQEMEEFGTADFGGPVHDTKATPDKIYNAWRFDGGGMLNYRFFANGMATRSVVIRSRTAGTSTSDVKLAISVDGKAYPAKTIHPAGKAYVGRAWSIPDLSDGRHSVRITASSINPGLKDHLLVDWVEVRGTDTAPPDTDINKFEGSPHRPYLFGNISNGSATFSVVASDNVGVSKIMCALVPDGQFPDDSYQQCATGGHLRKSYAGLTDGIYDFYAYAVDASGHADPLPASASFSVDTTVPTLTIDGPGDVSDRTASFLYHVSDANGGQHGPYAQTRLEITSGGATQVVKDWHYLSATDGSPAGESYSNLAPGSYTLKARAVDDAGNRSPLRVVHFTVS